MKNSLLKRVFATVASVPLALSQCLAYSSYAVTNDSVQTEAGNTNSSEKEVYTLKDNLLYIAPGQIESTWYSAFNAELVAIGNKNNGVNTIAKETIANAILKRAGKYSEKAQLAIDMIGEDGVQYTISPRGDITITGKVLNPDLSILTNGAQKRINEEYDKMKQKYEDTKKEISEKFDIPEEEFETLDVSKEELAAKYGVDLAELEKYDFTKEDIAAKLEIDVEELADVETIDDVTAPTFDFSNVDFSGTYEIVIEGSDLANGYTVDVKAKYITNTPINGKTVFSVGDATDAALAKLDEIKASAYATIDEIMDANAKAEAKAEFDGKFAKAEKWINKAKNNQDKVYTVNRSTSAANMAGVIDAVNNYIENGKYGENGKYSSQINKIENKVESIINKDLRVPSSATAVANNSYVADIYDIVMKEINKMSVNYDVEISASDIASFADNDLYNLTATAASGTYTLTGDFPDDEVADSVKHMVATVEAGDIYNADNTLATVGFRIYRDPVTTTSTTTTETTTTDSTTTTTTVSDDDGSSTTTTETTTTVSVDDGSSTTTTETSTTVSGDDGSSTTTTETTTTGSDDDGSSTTTTETTTTGSDDDGSSTTTTETTTTGSDDDGSSTTTTETTTTGSGDGSTTTTTTFGGVLPGEVKRMFVTVNAADDAEYGFYYSYDEEFHREQVKDVILNVIYTDDTEDTISLAYDFASTPAETFVRGDEDFKYIAALVYAGDDITDATGKVVLANGDALKTEDDEDAGVVAYIGYRGDISLDYDVNAVDATQAQVYYAELSTGKETGKNSTNTILSISNSIGEDTLVTIDGADSIYDQFAAFLGDVNMSNQEGEIINWLNGKKGRTIDAVDATGIMMAYAQLSIVDNTYKVGDKGLWDTVLAE